MNTQEHTYKHTHFIAYFIFPTEFECEMSSGSILHTHTQYQPFNEPAFPSRLEPSRTCSSSRDPQKNLLRHSSKKCQISVTVLKTEGDPKTPLSVRDTCTD